MDGAAVGMIARIPCAIGGAGKHGVPTMEIGEKIAGAKRTDGIGRRCPPPRRELKLLGPPRTR